MLAVLGLEFLENQSDRVDVRQDYLGVPHPHFLLRGQPLRRAQEAAEAEEDQDGGRTHRDITNSFNLQFYY